MSPAGVIAPLPSRMPLSLDAVRRLALARLDDPRPRAATTEEVDRTDPGGGTAETRVSHYLDLPPPAPLPPCCRPRRPPASSRPSRRPPSFPGCRLDTSRFASPDSSHFHTAALLQRRFLSSPANGATGKTFARNRRLIVDSEHLSKAAMSAKSRTSGQSSTPPLSWSRRLLIPLRARPSLRTSAAVGESPVGRFPIPSVLPDWIRDRSATKRVPCGTLAANLFSRNGRYILAC